MDCHLGIKITCKVYFDNNREAAKCFFVLAKVLEDKTDTDEGESNTTIIFFSFFRCTALSAVGLSVLLSVLLCYCIGKPPHTLTHCLSFFLSLSYTRTHASAILVLLLWYEPIG